MTNSADPDQTASQTTSEGSLIRVFPVCYSDHFVNSPLITNILFENSKRKEF